MEFSARFAERYEIVRPLGKGGMGEVFLARSKATARLVAIKTVQAAALAHAGAKERFLREARITAGLSHPHIIKVQDHGEDQGQLYIAFDFVEGGDLSDLLRTHGRLAPDAFFQVAIPVLDAVAHAHAAGVLHRDLKAANIFLDVDGSPFVADFGLAKGDDDEALRTATGVIMGTPRYMAPELGLGERASSESDQYALGILCFELLAGRSPFDAPQPLALLRMHIDVPVPVLSAYRTDVPASVEAAIARSLAKRREARWASVAEFRDALIAARDAGEAWVDRRGDGDGATLQIPAPTAPGPAPSAPHVIGGRVPRVTRKMPAPDLSVARRSPDTVAQPAAPEGGAGTASGPATVSALGAVSAGPTRRPTAKSLTIPVPVAPPTRRGAVAVVVVALAVAALGAWRVAVARRGDTRFDAVDLRVARGRSTATVSWSAELPAARVRVLRGGTVAATATSTCAVRFDTIATEALNLRVELEDAGGVTHLRQAPPCAAVTTGSVLAGLRRVSEVPDSGARDGVEAKLPLLERYTRRLALSLSARSGGKPTLTERYQTSPSQRDEARQKSGIDRVLAWYREEDLEGLLEQAAEVMDGASWREKAELYALAHRIATFEAFCINSGFAVPPVASRFLAGLGTPALPGRPGVLAGGGDFSRAGWFTQVVTGEVPAQEAERMFQRGLTNPASGAVTVQLKDAIHRLSQRKSNALLELADAFKSANLMAVEFAPATHSSIHGMAVAEPLELAGLTVAPTGASARPARLRVLLRLTDMNRYSHVDLTWGDRVVLCHRVPPGLQVTLTQQEPSITFLTEIDTDAVLDHRAPPRLTAHCDPSDVLLEQPANVDQYWRTGVDLLALVYRP